MTNLIKFRGFMPHGAASETHSLRFIQYCIVLAHCRAESDDEENGSRSYGVTGDRCDKCNITVCFDTGSLYQLR